MKKNIFVLSVLLGALSIVQGAWGMEIEALDERVLDTLFTLNGVSISKQYPDIAKKGAFRVPAGKYEARSRAFEKSQDTFKVILVKKEQGDNPVGLVALMKQRNNNNRLFTYYQMDDFFRGQGSCGNCKPDEIKEGLMFTVHPITDGTSCCVEVVDGFDIKPIVAAGTTIDFTQLKTLDGTPITQKYPDIIKENAFREVTHLHEGKQLSSDHTNNVVEAIRIQTEDDCDAVLAYIRREGERRLSEPYFMLYHVERYCGTTKKDIVKPENDKIFQLNVKGKGGGTAGHAIKIVNELTVNAKDFDLTEALRILKIKNLSTLEGISLITMYPGIILDGAFKTNDVRCSAHIALEKSANTRKAMVVKDKDGVEGVLVIKKQRNSGKTCYELYDITNLDTIENGKLFDLKAETVGNDGGFLLRIEVVTPTLEIVKDEGEVVAELTKISLDLEQIKQEQINAASSRFSWFLTKALLGGVATIALIVIILRPDLLSKIGLAK